jgi:putative transposase
MMVAFIDDHREEHGVEPICEVLPIAPSTYYARKTVEADPALRSYRAKRDEYLKAEVRRVWEENLRVYGVRKVWRQLNREGSYVARCTVAWLMEALGLQGAVRGKRFKATTIPDESRRVRSIWWRATLRWRRRTVCGYRISRTSRRGATSCMWHL